MKRIFTPRVARSALTLLRALCVTAPFASSPVSADVDVEALVTESERAAYYAGDDGRAEARMLIVDDRGRKQMRQFTVLRKDIEDNGDQRLMVFFSRPTDVRDTVFRVEKHAGTDDDRWLYLPALDLARRVSAADKRTSFVGSHFLYEDVSGRAVSQDDFRLIEEDDERFVLEGKARAPDEVEFERYVVEIDKATSLPLLIDFFEADGTHYRRVETIDIEEIEGHPTVLRSKVSDLIGGGYTLLEFRDVGYDVGLPDKLFGERSLRNPPRQWLP